MRRSTTETDAAEAARVDPSGSNHAAPMTDGAEPVDDRHGTHPSPAAYADAIAHARPGGWNYRLALSLGRMNPPVIE